MPFFCSLFVHNGPPTCLQREHLLLGIEPPFTACANHDNIDNINIFTACANHDSYSYRFMFVEPIQLQTAWYVAIMLLGTSSMCKFCYHMHKYFMLVPTMAFLYDGASTITQCANRARKSVYFLRKTKMADGRFLVFRRALLGRSVFAHVAPSRTLYDRGSNAL